MQKVMGEYHSNLESMIAYLLIENESIILIHTFRDFLLHINEYMIEVCSPDTIQHTISM